MLGTATTVAEAIALREAGVDAVIAQARAASARHGLPLHPSLISAAQGFEAGGERATFLEEAPFLTSQVGTMTLVPSLTEVLGDTPVVARCAHDAGRPPCARSDGCHGVAWRGVALPRSGGIMDARGIVAAFALGAVAVQMGSAFLCCRHAAPAPARPQASSLTAHAGRESGASHQHKLALSRPSTTEQSTMLTSGFTGKPGRALRTHYATAMEQHVSEIPRFPFQARHQRRRGAAAQACPA